MCGLNNGGRDDWTKKKTENMVEMLKESKEEGPNSIIKNSQEKNLKRKMAQH